jgi:hypothetical protein
MRNPAAKHTTPSADFQTFFNKARLSYYGRLCHRETVIAMVKGVPAFQLAPLEEDDDLIDRLLEYNPKFGDYLKTCLKSRSLSSAETLRRLK